MKTHATHLPNYVATQQDLDRSAYLNPEFTLKASGRPTSLTAYSNVNELLSQIGLEVPRCGLRRTVALNTISTVLSQIVAHSRMGRWTRLHMGESAYATGGLCEGLSYAAVRELVEKLEAADLLVRVKGFSAMPGYKQGRLTCVRLVDECELLRTVSKALATEELSLTLKNRYQVCVRDRFSGEVTWIKRADIKNELHQTLFNLYEATLANTSLTIEAGSDPSFEGAGEVEVSDLAHGHIVENGPGLGGRFYTAINRMRSTTRATLKFNGHRTTEVDLKASHLSILASKEGVLLPEDPYTFGEFSRTQNKQLLLSAINCRSKRQLKATYTYYTRSIDNAPTYEAWEASAKLHLGDVAHWFGTNQGLKLQCVEARIIHQAMVHYMSLTSQFCTPVHDSVIVRSEHAHYMARCLWTAFAYEIGATNLTASKRNFKATADHTTYKAQDLKFATYQDTL